VGSVSAPDAVTSRTDVLPQVATISSERPE
jgi:hypothetical protein